MARRRTRSLTKQLQEVKKSAGKSVKQSGDWFQRNKALITWTLAIAFIFTCIGIAGLVFIFSPNEQKQSNKSPEQQAIDDEMNEIKYWRGRVGDNPEDSIAFANLASAYQKAAIRIHSQNLGKEPKPEDKKKYDEYLKFARENYEKALEKDSSYTFATANLADIYLLMGKSGDAIKLLKGFIEKAEQIEINGKKGSNASKISDEEKNSIYEKLCCAYYQSGEYEKAIEVGEKVLKNDPGNFNVYVYLTKSFDALKNYDKAIDFAENAKLVGIDKVRNSTDAQERMSMFQTMIEIESIQKRILDTFMKSEAYEQAINAANKILENETSNFETHLFVARAYRSMKNYDAALEKLDEVRKICDEFKKKSSDQQIQSVNDVLIKSGIIQGEIYSYKKDYKKAVEAYEAARELAKASKDEKVIADLDARIKKLPVYITKETPTPKFSVEKEEKSPIPLKTP